MGRIGRRGVGTRIVVRKSFDAVGRLAFRPLSASGCAIMGDGRSSEPSSSLA